MSLPVPRRALKVIQASGGDLARLQHDPVYATQVGQAFDHQDLLGPASVGYGRGAAAPDAPLSTTFSYALSLQRQGLVEEAVAAFTYVSQSNPSWTEAHSALLNALLGAQDGVPRYAEEAQRWRRVYGDGHRLSAAPFDNPPRRGRPLRIGYVVPAMDGAARRHLEPVLDNHDPEQVIASLYLKRHDLSGPIRAHAARVIGDMDDARATALIRADAIDVLVDLAGHGAEGRLGVFARRPAPVQASWLDDVQTTGVPEIDYLIQADASEAPDAREGGVEAIWRIGPVSKPFRCDARGGPTPTPAKARGFVTFGGCAGPAQLNDPTLDAWSGILKRVPGSRLVLHDRHLLDEVLQNGILMRLAARGVEPDRIVFKGAADAHAYAEIDLVLDPAPSAGSAALDAAANGVPVMTLAGTDRGWRAGVAALGPLGLGELTAAGWDDYVDRAVGLVSDIEALDGLRQRVRAAFDRSAYRDEPGFTRRLEAAYADMFDRWRGRLADRTAA